MRRLIASFRRARLAPVAEAERMSGFRVGSIPPFDW